MLPHDIGDSIQKRRNSIANALGYVSFELSHWYEVCQSLTEVFMPVPCGIHASTLRCVVRESLSFVWLLG